MLKELWNSFKTYNKRIFRCTRGGFLQDIGRAFGVVPRKKIDLSPITGAEKPQLFRESPVGASLNERLLAALRGEGVGPSQIGFDPALLSKTTSPITQQREARFKEVEQPFLSGEFSGRGLGRSTVAGREIGRASAQKERDINEIIGNAILMNEQQKKIDEAQRSAEAQGVRQQALGFAAGETGAQQVRAAEGVRRAEIGVGAQQARNIQGSADIDRLIATALSLTGQGQTAQLFSPQGGGQAGGQGGGDTADISALLNLLKQGGQAASMAKAFI